MKALGNNKILAIQKYSDDTKSNIAAIKFDETLF